MSITRKDLLDFNRFADAKLTNGSPDSLPELASQWEATRQYQGSVAALRESHADAEAGRTVPLAEAFADVRERTK